MELISNFDLFNLSIGDEQPLYTTSQYNEAISGYKTDICHLINNGNIQLLAVNENRPKTENVYVKNFESFLQSEPSPKIQSYMGGVNDEDDFPEEEE
ncbi:MAG: hypothetical protein J1E16_00645 [Muribaculaceae bacterium]|nr:hypothetical protein [Muribaculaceae bacterium]